MSPRRRRPPPAHEDDQAVELLRHKYQPSGHLYCAGCGLPPGNWRHTDASAPRLALRQLALFDQKETSC